MSYIENSILGKTRGMKPLLNKISKFGRIFILLVAIIFGYSLIQNIQTILSADTRIQLAYQKLEQSKQENNRLSEQIREVESPFFEEKQARDKLGLAKPGETVVVLPDEATLRRLAPPQLEQTDESLPAANWKKWLELFF